MGDFDGRRTAAIGFAITAGVGFFWLGSAMLRACPADEEVTPFFAPLGDADAAVEAFLRADPAVAESFGPLESVRRRLDALSLQANEDGARFTGRYDVVGAKAAGQALVTLERGEGRWKLVSIELQASSRPSAGTP